MSSHGRRQATHKARQRRALLKARRRRARVAFRSGAAAATLALVLTGPAPATAVPTVGVSEPPPVESSANGAATSTAFIGSTLYFVADDGTTGSELWKSDGTTAGTVMVSNIRPDEPTGRYSGSNPYELTAVGGTLFFTAFDGTRRALYRSDGTTAGTVRVKNNAPHDATGPHHLTAVGDTLFFLRYAERTGNELWRSDGTTAGTVLVKDIARGAMSGVDPGYVELAAVGSTLFFAADDGTSGRELWRSDGTARGTVMVRNVGSGYEGSYPRYLTVAAGTVFFAASGAGSAAELWKSDGTRTGTVRVKDIRPGSTGSEPKDLTALGGSVFFVADDGVSGRELWASNGTSAGTRLVADVRPGIEGSTPEELTAVGSALYFAAFDGSTGRELWRTDRTAAGATLVADINPRTDDYIGEDLDPAPRDLTAIGNRFLFTVDDGTHGRELWRSDGTAAGTFLVRDLDQHFVPLAFRAPSLAAVNGRLFFATVDPASSSDDWAGQLWTSNGTAAGTRSLRDINPD